ncbi:hypothetical protein GCM10010517_58290 [Streptosporangium fragile]|uniref:GAF domain-containing protein n=1 Tax=Streptosporangium fragile TaxID=46186 RepID=A0ABN3W752_9ACTN
MLDPLSFGGQQLDEFRGCFRTTGGVGCHVPLLCARGRLDGFATVVRPVSNAFDPSGGGSSAFVAIVAEVTRMCARPAEAFM